MNSSFSKKITSSRGFSLIEILISLVVLSIGLMGLGGLQLAALKGSNEAHYRTEGSLLMMDFADRMRANLEGVSEGDYRIPTAGSVSCTTEPSFLCDEVSCTARQLAVFDKYSMVCGENGVRGVLPSGELTVECASNNCTASDKGLEEELNKTHNIIVSWRENKRKNENRSDGIDYKVRTITLSIVP